MDYVWIAVVFLSAIVLHEVAHGLVALWNGDDTAKRAGRLTLNPIPHMDFLGTIFLIIVLTTGFGIGWAKPVPINPSKFRNFRFGLFTVAIAGPITNVLLALLSLVLAFAAVKGLIYFPGIWTLIRLMFILNLLLASFNLIPVPPLDGSRIVSSILPPRAIAAYNKIEPVGIFIIFALLFFPLPFLGDTPPLRMLFHWLVVDNFYVWLDDYLRWVSA